MEIVEVGDEILNTTAVLDALPYIDPVRSEQLKRQVNHMVEEEMKTFEAQDYLAHIQMPEFKLEDSIILKNEFERMRQGRELNALHQERYQVLDPTREQAKVLPAWHRVVDNAKTRLSEQDENSINLQLCKDFGVEAWKQHAVEMRKVQDWIKKETQTAKDAKDDINRKRKHDQTQKKRRIRSTGK